jgi:glycine oxidase
MTGTGSSRKDTVIIIGAGAIGLSIGWRLAQRGVKVTIFDRGAAGSGATYAAAGMLAANAEAEPGEEKLIALNRASQKLWPSFADELEKVSGLSIDLRKEGTLLVALTSDDQVRLKHHLDFQHSLGLPLEWISAAEARRYEPHITPKMVGAIFSRDDHQVENRKLTTALFAAAVKAGAILHEHTPVERFILNQGRVEGVVAGGNVYRADVVILAAGAWSRGIEGLPAEARPPVRPVKGQMIALKMDPRKPILTHQLWAPGVYLVPRLDGRLLVGATVEEKGFDASLTAGAQLSLLDAAWRALPAIEELAIEETWAGFRPGSRDDAPVLGYSPVEGLVYATGHYRNGILLTPITAEAITSLILDGKMEPVVQPFGLERFGSKVMAAE